MTRLPVPVPHFSPAHRDLVWRAVRPDPDGILIPAGVLIAESIEGVVLTVADDHRNRVLVLDPDYWADLCDAVKSGVLDGVLGGRIMCEDPDRPLNPATATPASEPTAATITPSLGRSSKRPRNRLSSSSPSP